MIELAHTMAEPEELHAYRKQYPSHSWDEAQPIVGHATRHQLNREQDGLCVYCECLLAEGEGHVEHIKSQKAHPKLVLEYINLAHSCDSSKHCGHKKHGSLLPIEPRPGCNHFFALMSDGRLEPKQDLSAEDRRRAAESLTVLGLNDLALVQHRKSWIASMSGQPDEDVFALIATAPFRWSLRRWFAP